MIYEFKISKTNKLEKNSCVLDRVYTGIVLIYIIKFILKNLYTQKKVKVAKSMCVRLHGYIFVNINVILGRLLPPTIYIAGK